MQAGRMKMQDCMKLYHAKEYTLLLHARGAHACMSPMGIWAGLRTSVAQTWPW
jgi:hypothetical protein